MASMSDSLLATTASSESWDLPEVTHVWNFAYGANLSTTALKRRRVTPVERVGAVLVDHRLAFCHRGAPGLEPVFANVEYCAGNVVHGSAILLSKEHFARILHTEGRAGIGPGYQPVPVNVTLYDGRTVLAFTLFSDTQTTGGMPSRRYMNLIVHGARENLLNEEYVRALLALPTHHKSKVAMGIYGVALLLVSPILLPIFLVMYLIPTPLQAALIPYAKQAFSAISGAIWSVYHLFLPDHEVKKTVKLNFSDRSTGASTSPSADKDRS